MPKAKKQEEVKQQQSNAADGPVILIPPIRMARLEVEIVGDTPLLLNAFSHKAKEQMKKRYGDGIKEPRGKAAPPDEDLFEGAIHRTPDGDAGYPGGGIKKALLVAAMALDLDQSDRRRIKSGIYVIDDLITIKGKPTMDIRWGRNSGIARSPRRIVRAIVQDWSMRVRIMYDADIHKPEQIINLMNRAGVYSGLGEWRPSSSKPGTYGMFHVKLAG